MSEYYRSIDSVKRNLLSPDGIPSIENRKKYGYFRLYEMVSLNGRIPNSTYGYHAYTIEYNENSVTPLGRSEITWFYETNQQEISKKIGQKYISIYNLFFKYYYSQINKSGFSEDLGLWMNYISQYGYTANKPDHEGLTDLDIAIQTGKAEIKFFMGNEPSSGNNGVYLSALRTCASEYPNQEQINNIMFNGTYSTEQAYQTINYVTIEPIIFNPSETIWEHVQWIKENSDVTPILGKYELIEENYPLIRNDYETWLRTINNYYREFINYLLKYFLSFEQDEHYKLLIDYDNYQELHKYLYIYDQGNTYTGVFLTYQEDNIKNKLKNTDNLTVLHRIYPEETRWERITNGYLIGNTSRTPTSLGLDYIETLHISISNKLSKIADVNKQVNGYYYPLVYNMEEQIEWINKWLEFHSILNIKDIDNTIIIEPKYICCVYSNKVAFLHPNVADEQIDGIETATSIILKIINQTILPYARMIYSDISTNDYEYKEITYMIKPDIKETNLNEIIEYSQMLSTIQEERNKIDLQKNQSLILMFNQTCLGTYFEILCPKPKNSNKNTQHLGFVLECPKFEQLLTSKEKSNIIKKGNGYFRTKETNRTYIPGQLGDENKLQVDIIPLLYNQEPTDWDNDNYYSNNIYLMNCDNVSIQMDPEYYNLVKGIKIYHWHNPYPFSDDIITPITIPYNDTRKFDDVAQLYEEDMLGYYVLIPKSTA